MPFTVFVMPKIPEKHRSMLKSSFKAPVWPFKLGKEISNLANQNGAALCGVDNQRILRTLHYTFGILRLFGLRRTALGPDFNNPSYHTDAETAKNNQRRLRSNHRSALKSPPGLIWMPYHRSPALSKRDLQFMCGNNATPFSLGSRDHTLKTVCQPTFRGQLCADAAVWPGETKLELDENFHTAFSQVAQRKDRDRRRLNKLRKIE